MRLLRWFILWWLARKAKNLNKQKGYSPGEIVSKMVANPQISNALFMGGISVRELREAVDKKVKK